MRKRPAPAQSHGAAVVRCAIYTRKSSEDGLEQEFNSLDAQREACEAYIRSQRGAGWVALPAMYDDGGISGGTMDRPALQRLLADIGAGRVDTVVVYKVDRLTRSLGDFAKIVDAFDAKSVSFVSVTQQFNTTTSMGRLTLNMLLSFAQFEREVTGERIRDKIAASKQKGMWMGGNPPLGYDVSDRKLVVNAAEAETVRHIFRRYAELKSVRALAEDLDAAGIVSKTSTGRFDKPRGGKPIARGALYLMLQNRIYRGEIVHKDKAYPGLHDAIVDKALWNTVQAAMADNRVERVTRSKAAEPSRRQIAQIAASIDEFGFNNPVLIDEANVIMAGHGRVEAARKLGLETVPCVRIEHLTDAQKRAYILADNKLALNAGWDPEILSIELQHLTAIDLDFDVTITGFEMPEIDVLLGGAGKVQGTADPADDVTEVASGPAVTRPGDVWLIGRHRLMCGDARDPAAFARLLAGERAQMVFTDPPYNVKIDGHVCGLGGVRHREFVMASGEMTENEFTDFLAMVFRTLVAHAMDGALHYICMDWRHMREVLAAGIRQRAVEGNARALKLFQDLLARYNPPPPEKKGGYLVVPGGISVEKWEELMKASARMSQSWVEPKTDKATNAQDGAAVQPTRSTSQS